MPTSNLGESLLTKINSVDFVVGVRIIALEAKIAAATNRLDERITAIESQGQELATPLQTNRMDTTMPHNDSGTVSEGDRSARDKGMGVTTVRHSPAEGLTDDASFDVNACTHMAYNRAHALNPSLLTDTAGDNSGNNSGGTPVHASVKNLYLPSTMHRQPLHQKTLHETLGTIARPPATPCVARGVQSAGGSRAPNTSPSNTRFGRGGPIVSPPHSNRARHVRTLGTSYFDIICLTSKEYHIGLEGMDNLMEDDIRTGGNAEVKASAEDVVV